MDRLLFLLLSHLCFDLVLSDCCFDSDSNLLKCTVCNGECRGEKGYQTCVKVTVGDVTGIVIGLSVFVTIVLTIIVVIYYYIKNRKNKPPPSAVYPEKKDTLEIVYPKTKLTWSNPATHQLSSNDSKYNRGNYLKPIRNPPPTGKSSTHLHRGHQQIE